MTLVSVAVCVRDGVEWIDGCMESLVNQTHSPLEIILVDDGSVDGGKQKAEEWSNHDLVTVITQDALGLSAGRMALQNDQTTCIQVEGEEDLAPIIVHLLAPLGTNIVYGQPNTGVVLRITTLDAKEECRGLLSRFEVRD